jgi:hypothetical protein
MGLFAGGACAPEITLRISWPGTQKECLGMLWTWGASSKRVPSRARAVLPSLLEGRRARSWLRSRANLCEDYQPCSLFLLCRTGPLWVRKEQPAAQVRPACFAFVPVYVYAQAAKRDDLVFRYVKYGESNVLPASEGLSCFATMNQLAFCE